MRKIFFLTVIEIIATCVSIPAQDGGFPNTPYQTWSKAQADKIVLNSPWSKTTTFQPAPAETRLVGPIILPPRDARIMLRSAQPVRQALLRLRQIEAKYDKMTEAERNVFDTKNKALLDCPACTNYYVVWVTSKDLVMENKTYVSDRKKYVYLSNEKGERRELAELGVLSQQGNELVFYFPRADSSGRPLLTPGNTTLTFNFELRGLDGKSRFPFEKFDFKVADFVKDGVVLF